MDIDIQNRIEAGIEVVRQCIPYFREHLGKVSSQRKADNSRVTEADLPLSSRILGALGQRFPTDGLFSEEDDPATHPRPVPHFAWLLDPIDGTNNYVLGMPYCAISLALLVDGRPACGFVYDNGRDTITHGGPGIGLYDDGIPVPAMADKPLSSDGFVGLAFPIRGKYADATRKIAETCYVRCLGSGTLTLTYVALGFLEGSVDLRSKSWDIAAATAFIEAVGGEICVIDRPIFPLTSFDTHEKSRAFYAGTKTFCRYCGSLFDPLRA